MRLLMCESFRLICEYSYRGLLLGEASSRLSAPLANQPLWPLAFTPLIHIFISAGFDTTHLLGPIQ